MAVYSMTGFANATLRASVNHDTQAAAGAVNLELRSVNSRFLDLSFRIPDELRGLEGALRDLLTAAFRRGKIELRLNVQRESENAWPRPHPDQLQALAHVEDTVHAWCPKAAPLSVQEILQWCRSGGTPERIDDTVMDAARTAIEGLRTSRAREGERLVGILQARITHLRELAALAAPMIPEAVARQRQRFLERWRDALGEAGAAQAVSSEALQERALGEAAAYALRIDVAEELARLGAHLDEIERMLATGGELGKRLDFLIQELHREANTLGSKSSALELTRLAVDMKVDIEQLREQVQNIE